MYHLFYPKKFFFNICVLSQCIVIEYTFRIYIRLHIKKHYFIHFRCLLLKSLKILSVPLTSKSTCLNLGLCLCSLRLRQFLVFIDFYFSCMFFGSVRSFPNLENMSLLLHIIVTYIKENIIPKLQKLYSPARNPRAGNKSPMLFVKNPLCLGNLSPVCKIFIERPMR